MVERIKKEYKPKEQQVKEWLDRGKHDIEMAQLIYDEHGYTDTIAYFGF